MATPVPTRTASPADGGPDRRRAPADVRTAIAVGLLAMLAALAGIGARATYGARTTADEPQYLLTAISLYEDGSLDVADEIADGRYRPFHEIALDRQTSVRSDGSEVSPHDPLLPLLLAVPVGLGGWIAAKVLLAAIAAVTAALTLLVATRRWHVSTTAAGVVTAAAFVGLPLAGYGSQVYPELPAALTTLAGVAAVTAHGPTRRHEIVALLSVVALPWLAVKYAPVAAVLAIALLAGSPRRARLAVVLAGAGALYLAVHRAWYGGWTVYAAGDHFEADGEFAVVGTDVDVLGRSRRLIGLLVDRDFGLAAWSPIWLLLPVALVAVAVRRPRGWQVVVGVVLAGWLNATFVALTMHGWWVPGRQVVVVLPVAAVAMAWFVDRRPRLVVASAIAGLLGAVDWLWLAVEASTGRRTLVVDAMATGAWPLRAWDVLLPSGLRDAPVDRWLLAAWTVVIVAAMVLVVRREWSSVRSRPPGPSPTPAR